LYDGEECLGGGVIVRCNAPEPEPVQQRQGATATA
jgi:hypothetical protein